MLLTNEHPHKCHLEFPVDGGNFISFRHNETANISPELHQQLLKQKAYSDYISKEYLKSPLWSLISIEELLGYDDSTIIDGVIRDVTDYKYLSDVIGSPSTSEAVKNAAKERLIQLTALVSNLDAEPKQTKRKSSNA